MRMTTVAAHRPGTSSPLPLMSAMWIFATEARVVDVLVDVVEVVLVVEVVVLVLVVLLVVDDGVAVVVVATVVATTVTADSPRSSGLPIRVPSRSISAPWESWRDSRPNDRGMTSRARMRAYSVIAAARLRSGWTGRLRFGLIGSTSRKC
jgi:hypothetical protein